MRHKILLVLALGVFLSSNTQAFHSSNEAEVNVAAEWFRIINHRATFNHLFSDKTESAKLASWLNNKPQSIYTLVNQSRHRNPGMFQVHCLAVVNGKWQHVILSYEAGNSHFKVFRKFSSPEQAKMEFAKYHGLQSIWLDM